MKKIYFAAIVTAADATLRNSITGQNLSLQKVLLPGHDPGWNDPPKWAYSTSQSSSVTPIKRVLNKRVAFPMSSIKTIDKESSAKKPLNMPPPMQSSISSTTASHPPLLCPSNKNTKESMTDVEIDKQMILNTVLENLEAVINEHILEKSKTEELRKRLDLLKVVWLEDRLNNMIYKNVLDLSTDIHQSVSIFDRRNRGRREDGSRDTQIVKQSFSVRNEEGNGGQNGSFDFMTAPKLIAISS
ncbi:hypothetical protein WN51_00474 [Melipona quadrifasciata]|uniref:Uncharacterized protein n=1 Tax=Melipona quadrifasciata TaxID=166423 RepID=A0A0N0BGF7_9HYME|nr:hypothetical protein WN51_00474 [Melipona quadrifasciata]